MLHRLPLAAWFSIGAAVIGCAQLIHLGTNGWNPTVFLHVGADFPARGRIERDFPGLDAGPNLGHDGKYNYLVAREPRFWRADPETLASLQDPGYRYARPLYPLLAGLGGNASPWGTLIGLILVQTFAGGLCGAALASFARTHHLPTAFVSVNLANPGLFSSACLLTSDLLAHALALTAWNCFDRGRFRLGVVGFALSMLAKEYYALTPLALTAAFAAQRQWRNAVAVAILPLVPIVAWKLALLAEFGAGEGQRNLDWPGWGFAESMPGWVGFRMPVGWLGISLVVGALAFAGNRRLPRQLRWACAVWSLLGLGASRLVWNDPTDLLRAIAPLGWLIAWACFRRRGDSGTPNAAVTTATRR